MAHPTVNASRIAAILPRFATPSSPRRNAAHTERVRYNAGAPLLTAAA